MSHHSQNLLKFLNEDRERKKFCDVSVSVGGKTHCAHKAVLAHGSSYFHAEFSKNPDASHVTLDHVDESVFQHLLEFLYTSECMITETDIQNLTATARFLDMMDVLKLLSEEAQSVSPTQVDLTHDVFPCESVCDRPAGLVDNEKTSHLTSENHNIAKVRRSSRRKRTLKYRIDYEMESVVSKKAQTLKNSKEEAANEANTEVAVEADNLNFQDDNDDVEDDDGNEVDTAQLKIDQIPGQQDETSSVYIKSKTARSVIQEYPEGLAPVIIQASNKKTLQCPKCDKVFDRAAKYESHTRVHTGEKPFQCEICHQCYSTKSNLTVHKKKHDNDTLFSKKEHQCPSCKKLHASKKTLAKHIKR